MWSLFDNTNAQLWEMKAYVQAAKKHGYDIEFQEPETAWKSNVSRCTQKCTKPVLQHVIQKIAENFRRGVTVDDVLKSKIPDRMALKYLSFFYFKSFIMSATPSVWVNASSTTVYISLTNEQLLERILKSACNVMQNLGPGHSESVYRNALNLDLSESKHKVFSTQEVNREVHYRDQTVGHIRMDLLVEKRAVVELKTVASDLKPTHVGQLHRYLMGGKEPFGILVNFNKQLSDHLQVFIMRRLEKPFTECEGSEFSLQERNLKVFDAKTKSRF